MKDGTGGQDPKAPKKGFDLDDVIKEVLAEDEKKKAPQPGPEKPKEEPPRIERVSELVEGDFEEVSEDDEAMGPKDEAIQNYIADLEADLEEKLAALEAERNKRAQIESEVEKLKKDLEKAQKEEEADDTVQGYLSDLEADLKLKMDDLEAERKSREKLEKELAEMRSKMDHATKSQDEVSKIKAELDKTKATSDVEVARLENEQKRREQETDSIKQRVSELEDELTRKIALIEDMRTKTSDSEASIIDFRERVKVLENTIDAERKKGKDASSRAEGLASELQKMRDVLSTKVEEVEKVRTDLHTLEAMKTRLDEASNALDKESQERVRAESEIGKLRGNLTDIMQNMESDLTKYKQGQETALKDLEQERRKKTELETECKALKAQIDASASETQKELVALRAEKDKLQKENQEKQQVIEAEMQKLDTMKADLSKQKAALDKEKFEVDTMRARTEKALSDSSSEYTMKDVRLKAEHEGLLREKEQFEKRNYELTRKETRLADRERAIKDKENKLRNELRTKALGLTETVEEKPIVAPAEEEPVEEQGPEKVEEPEPVIPDEEKVEEPTPEPAHPRIWPPLGSHKDKKVKVEPRPEKTPRSDDDPKFKMGLPKTYFKERVEPSAPKTKKERRQLLWPDSAYEAEARVRNVSYEPESTGAISESASGKRHLIDSYVTAKAEPVSRPSERRMKCVCGAEFWASTFTPSEGLRCPKCGRRLS